jgi:hypothetical protein
VLLFHGMETSLSSPDPRQAVAISFLSGPAAYMTGARRVQRGQPLVDVDTAAGFFKRWGQRHG